MLMATEVSAAVRTCPGLFAFVAGCLHFYVLVVILAGWVGVVVVE